MSLIEHLRPWPEDDLAHLIQARPDLLPASDRGLEAVARKAATALSLGRVLVSADVGMLVVAEALVARHPATVDELDRLLGTGDPTGVVEAIERLRRVGVVVVDGTVISPVGALPDLLHRPLGLGPSFAELAEHLPAETIDRLASATNARGAEKRSATVRAIAHRLSQPDVVDGLLADAPADSVVLFNALVARRSPAVPLPTGYPYRGLDSDDPLAWLLDRGLVVPVSEAGAELPRELVMAARPDGLAPTAALRPIGLEPVAGLEPQLVAGRAADRANRLLDGVEALLGLIGRGEISVRKVGGVGPRELQRVSRQCRFEVLEAARLLELVEAARLVRVADGALTLSDLATRWWSLSRHRRYLVLARAWLCTDRFLSRGLGDDPDPAKVVALGDAEPIAAVSAGRGAALTTICHLADGDAFDPDQLAAAVVWQGPNLWGTGEPSPETLLHWTLDEAELLGLVSADAPAPVLRALVDGDEVSLEAVTRSMLADDQDTFVLQDDLTALSFGPLAPRVGRSLAEMAERAGPAGGEGAPTFRFTDTSVRAAFDRGWTAPSLLGFLTEHSLAGVPQPLEYLVTDVARRYGAIRVMPAQSIIVTDDDIAAVEIASNRKAAALGLRLVAPTVLTSPADPVTVIEGLRSLGLFPTLDGSSIVVDRPTSGPGRPDAEADLPADWTGPPVPTGPLPDEISDAVALLVHPVDDGARRAEPTGPGADDVTDRELQGFWGRPVHVDVVIEGRPDHHRGTLVGLGPSVSLLTTSGVVEFPRAAVVGVSDPASAR